MSLSIMQMLQNKFGAPIGSSQNQVDFFLRSRQRGSLLRPTTAPAGNSHLGSAYNGLSWKSIHSLATKSFIYSEVNMTNHPKVRSAVIKRKKRKRKQVFKNKKQEEEYMEELLLNQKFDYLFRHTHFTLEEIHCLNQMFEALVTNSSVPGEMDRSIFLQTFQNHFGILDDVILDQLFYYFDSDHQGSISVTEWIRNLSTILRGTLEEHIELCYSIYDLNGDGGIGRQEIAKLLEGCIRKIPGLTLDLEDEFWDNSREVIDMIFKKFDLGSGQITMESYRSAIIRDPLLLQALGSCLPPAEKVRTFMILLTEDYNDIAVNYSLEHDPGYAYESKRYDTLELKAKKQLKIIERGPHTTTTATVIRSRRLQQKKKTYGSAFVHNYRPVLSSPPEDAAMQHWKVLQDVVSGNLMVGKHAHRRPSTS